MRSRKHERKRKREMGAGINGAPITKNNNDLFTNAGGKLLHSRRIIHGLLAYQRGDTCKGMFRRLNDACVPNGVRPSDHGVHEVEIEVSTCSFLNAIKMTSSQYDPISGRKFYVKSHKLNCEEDLYHEFKGHRNICSEELPFIAVTQGRRKAISRNLCGFLNTGVGGIVYVGVDDAGEVGGIPLTPYQIDHVLLSVQDVFSRFDPPVDHSMYDVRFVPVKLCEDETLPSPDAFVIDANMKKQAHLMRTSKYCWCDLDARARFDTGIIDQYYIIEIEVFPWNPNHELAVTSLTRVQPLFRNEEGLYFIRGIGVLHQPSILEVIQMAEADCYAFYAKVVQDEMPKLEQAPVEATAECVMPNNVEECSEDFMKRCLIESNLAQED